MNAKGWQMPIALCWVVTRCCWVQWHIEVGTKWLTFHRWHFETHLLSLVQIEARGLSLTFREVLQNILSKFVYCRNHTSYENFKLKLCTCAQSHALGTRTKFQLELLTINVLSGFVYFCEIILESSRNVSETTPRYWTGDKPLPEPMAAQFSDAYMCPQPSTTKKQQFSPRHSQLAGLILGLRPTNERRRYKVTASPIGWAQT